MSLIMVMTDIVMMVGRMQEFAIAYYRTEKH